MNDILANVVNGLFTVAWIVCIILWFKGGCPIPRWVHVLAVMLQLLGIGVIIACGVAGMITLKLLLLCLLVPVPAAYLGWLWMLGTWLEKTQE